MTSFVLCIRPQNLFIESLRRLLLKIELSVKGIDSADVSENVPPRLRLQYVKFENHCVEQPESDTKVITVSYMSGWSQYSGSAFVDTDVVERIRSGNPAS